MGILKRIFSRKPAWNGTPEMFLAMVMELQSMNNPETSLPETLVLGEIMLNLFEVTLAPYNDFADLLARGTPDFSKIKSIRKEMQAINDRLELKKAIYGRSKNSELADVASDDPVVSGMTNRLLSKAGAYVRFQDEQEN